MLPPATIRDTQTNFPQTPIGKVDEICGPLNQVYFTIKPQEGIQAKSFKAGDKFYIGGDKLLPLDRCATLHCLTQLLLTRPGSSPSPSPLPARRALRSLLVQVAVVDPVAVPVAAVAEAHPEDEADPPAAAAVSHEADRLAVAVAAVEDSRGVDVVVAVVASAAVDVEDTKHSGGFSLWYHPGPQDYQPIPRSFDGVWELNWVFLYMWNIGAMLKIRKTDAMSIGRVVIMNYLPQTCNTRCTAITNGSQQCSQQFNEAVEQMASNSKWQSNKATQAYYAGCGMQANPAPTRRLDTSHAD
jgi:hypothetical protein